MASDMAAPASKTINCNDWRKRPYTAPTDAEIKPATRFGGSWKNTSEPGGGWGHITAGGQKSAPRSAAWLDTPNAAG
jgi:hypothetical protein